MGLSQTFSMCQLAGEPFSCCPGHRNLKPRPSTCKPWTPALQWFISLCSFVPLWLFHRFARDLVASDRPEEESMGAPIVGTQ